MNNTSRTRGLVLSGLSIALLAVGAMISVPFGPVPFTLQTMMLGIIICILSPKQSVVAVGGYLLLGAFGLPIFAGMRGGIAVLAGPTGGFLIGFFLATVIIAILRSKLVKLTGDVSLSTFRKTKVDRETSPVNFIAVDVLSLVVLSLVYYALGCVWFSFVANTGLDVALTTCVVPFVLPDILKAIAAVVCAQPVRAALRGNVKTVA
ncbi:BioY family transporter [Actinomycetota bacterium]|nr:BioY family transporter [Actinomycetota bacterium]